MSLRKRYVKDSGAKKGESSGPQNEDDLAPETEPNNTGAGGARANQPAPVYKPHKILSEIYTNAHVSKAWKLKFGFSRVLKFIF